MYQITVIIKMDKWHGIWPFHAWVDVRVWPDNEHLYIRTAGLGIDEKGHKNIIIHKEELDRPWNYKATFNFESSVNLFNYARWIEINEIIEQILNEKKYKIFNNNCRAFVDAFMDIYFGISHTCGICFDCKCTNQLTYVCAYNYIVNGKKYYFEYEINNHKPKYYCYDYNKDCGTIYEVTEKEYYLNNKIQLIDNRQEYTQQIIDDMKEWYRVDH